MICPNCGSPEWVRSGHPGGVENVTFECGDFAGILPDGTAIKSQIAGLDENGPACRTIAQLRAEVAELREASAWIVECEKWDEGAQLANEKALAQALIEHRRSSMQVSAELPPSVQEWAILVARRQGRDESAAELAALRAFADGWSSFRDQFDDIQYHHSGMGCGIEDRGITDRYAACEHGWECAMERVAERFPEIDTLDALRSQKEGQP